jgi:hypothetical protein
MVSFPVLLAVSLLLLLLELALQLARLSSVGLWSHYFVVQGSKTEAAIIG